MRTKKVTEFGEFAVMLRTARTHRGLTQAVLADHLGIGQQALSNWERGTSRPESRDIVVALAALFPEHPRDAWLNATQHLQPSPPLTSSTRPVRPLLAELPFNKLSFEQFQDFCTQLLRYCYPTAYVHAFGVPGDAQRGIDIEARFPDGSLHTFQCKRHERFGPALVKSTIQAHTVRATLAVILLSRTATAAVRTEISRRRKQKWQLWDSKDISERIRTLSQNDALKLVDAFFPQFRSDFLGAPLPCTFEGPERFFSPQLRASSVFSHQWAIVGRDADLDAVRRALASPNDDVLVVSGPGGIGKSRLIREVVSRYGANNPGLPIFLLASHAAPGAHDYELVGEKAGLVVVEDAHDRDDLAAVLHSLMRVRHRSRIILVCRPYALDAIRTTVLREGAAIASGFPLTLAGLSVDQAQSVATEILTARHGPVHIARDIAKATRDSPLALVVGSNLVASRRIHPRVLTNAAQFRDALLVGFRDAITGSVGPPADQSTLRTVLELVSLFQPVPATSGSFVSLAARLTDRPEVDIRRAVDLLSNAGVLLKKARRLRISPDVLGDYLSEDLLRRDTQILERVLDACDSDQLGNLLVNTAKVDWRLDVADESHGSLSDSVWSRLAELSEPSSPLPDKLSDGVANAAYYRPEQALALFDRLHQCGCLPENAAQILRRVAMNADFAERACRRLLELGSADSRAQNQHPDHPLRILKELAQVEPNKPVDFCELIVDFVIERIERRASPRLNDALFDVLRSALQPDGHTTDSDGRAFSIRNFAVRLAAVRGLRAKIIGALFKLMALTSPQTSHLAATTLGDALRAPRNVASDVHEEWGREFEDTLRRWRRLVEETRLPATTTVAIEKAIHWHVTYSAEPVRTAAQQLFAAITQSLEHRVTLAMIDPWGHTRIRAGASTGWIERWREEMAEIADELIAKAGDATKVVDFLRARALEIEASNSSGGDGGGQFAFIVASKSRQIAQTLCDACMLDPKVGPFFGSALSALFAADPAAAMSAIFSARKLEGDPFALPIAWTLSARQALQGATSIEERTQLLDLLQSKDARVVSAALNGIGRLAAVSPSIAAQAFVSVDLAQIPGAMHAFFDEAVSNPALRAALLEERTLRALLKTLRSVPSIEDYWAEEFLKHVAQVAPDDLVELLLDRIDVSARKQSRRDFQPLPYLWGTRSALHIADPLTRRRILRRIATWMLAVKDHPEIQFWAPKLFGTLSGGIGPSAVTDLMEWAKQGGLKHFNVVLSILREVPADFVLENVGVVADLFQLAESFGAKAIRDCRSSLFAASVSGSRHGSIGEPFPEDVSRKSKAHDALARLPRGSAVAEFYALIRRDAEADICSKMDEDQALIEEHE